MKAQILKIAGVKTEAEFYKKFPTEEAFMKKHGDKLKKAVDGITVEEEEEEDGVMGKPFVGMPVKFNKFNVSANPNFNTSVSNNPYLSGSLIGGAKTNSLLADDNTTKTTTTGSDSKKNRKKDRMDALNMLSNQAGSIIGLSQSMIDKYGRQSKQLDQYGKVAALAKKAAASAPRPPKEKYVRPEDQMVQPINPLGVQGFGYFENGGEIQNTFAPNTIYTDMGYEPLNDSNPKQYVGGGIIASTANAAGGFDPTKFMSSAASIGGGLGSLIGGGDLEQTEEGNLGSSIGGLAGTLAFGPLGGLIGSAAGGLIGGAIGGKKNKQMKEKKQNLQNSVASAAGVANIQNMNQGSAFVRNGGNIASYENGGWMNPEYNPQVIAKFGDYDVDQLLAPPHDADMLRAGGHLKEYTPPSERAMYTGKAEYGVQMAMGGDLKVHRGKAETMSYNPFLPNGGETVMFRGPSHDNGGMPISFGENGVEVEGGEPAIQMQDGGEEGNLVVYGNMVIPEYGAEELGDPKAKGKKFKHYVADLSKVEAKQNKMLDKTMSLIDQVNGDDPFDQLTLNSGQANLIGATMKLKDIADKKMNAAAVQNAILDTAEEHGLESDALAKGKIKYAKANDPYAEFGAKLEQFKPGGKKGKKAAAPLSPLQSFIKEIKYPERAQMAKAMGIPNYKGTAEQNEFLFKKTLMSEQAPLRPALPKPIEYDTKGEMIKAVDKSIAANNFGHRPDLITGSSQTSPFETAAMFANSIIPYMRPSNQMELEPVQLAPEMLALSDNTLDPVYAQTYQPQYTQPTSISFQDQLNANQSDFNAMQRQLGYNPDALAALAAQKYGANSKVLAEQFRMNQAERQRAMEANRETANDAQLKNMAIYQDQATKMAQTRSTLKQQKQVALSSIADKIAKNKLENRQLGVAENLYNYRYTPSGVAYNVNPFAQWAPYGSGSGGKGSAGQLAPGKKFSYDENQQIIGTYNSSDKEDAKVRNGSIVKAIKNL